MDRGTKGAILSRLLMIMAKVVDQIYQESNPRVAISHIYDNETGLKVSAYQYILDNKPIYGNVDEYYVGEEARKKYLGAVLNTYSHILQHISEIISVGSSKKEEKMFRIIKRILSIIEDEEKYDKKSLLDGKLMGSLQFELFDLLLDEENKNNKE